MPREFDDNEPVAKRKKPFAKSSTRETDSDEPGGARKPLLITFGCVLVAFAGIMAYVLMTAPKAAPIAVNGPSSDSALPATPGGDPLKPNPGNPKTNDPNTPQPDDWTPPPFTRPASPLAEAKRITFVPDLGVPSQRWGSSPKAVYLDRHGLVFAAADNNRSSLVGYDEKARAPLLPPNDLKAGDGVGGVTATADQSAVFAPGNGRMYRFVVDGRRWESASITGLAYYIAIAPDRFLGLESVGKTTQFRLYRWPVGSTTITLSARWEVEGENARATFDAASGSLWVVRSFDALAKSGHLDRFALTGRGGSLQVSIPLPFAVGVAAPPVLSPDGRRVYLKDRAVEVDRLLPTKYAGEVKAAIGGVVFLAGTGFADADTGILLGYAQDDVYDLEFASDGTAVWGADMSRKSPGFRRFMVTTGERPPTPTEPKPTEPKPIEPKPPVVPKESPTIKLNELASLPAPDRGLLLFRHCEKHNLLVYSDLSGTTILDAKTGNPSPLPKLDGKARIRSADFSPDGAALFASDGQNLHRLDLTTRKWESRPNFGTRVLAVDSSTVLVLVKPNGPTTFALVRWEPTKLTEVSRLEWPALYELGYDPTAKALYALHAKVNGSPNAVFEKYNFKDGTFVTEWNKNVSGAVVKVTLHPLSGNGKFFFNGQRSWSTTPDDRIVVTEHTEPLVGATRDTLVGASGKIYAAGNVPAVLGRFPRPVELVSAAPDGQTVWVLCRTAKKFIQYKLEPSEKKQ